MSKFLFYLFAVPIGLFLVIFSLNNRVAVMVDLWPMPYYIEIKLFLLVIICMALGGLLAICWQLLALLSRKTQKIIKSEEK